MPFAGYKNFDECVRKNSSKKDPKAYCATIMRKVEEGSMPTEHRIIEIFDVSEAIFEVQEGTGKLYSTNTLLKAGRSANKRHYREKAVREAAEMKIFDGARMFVDHSTSMPSKRSVTEMVSAVESTWYDEASKALKGKVEYFNKDFYEYAQRARSYMGNSIKTIVRGERIRQPDGSIEEEVYGFIPGADKSVDWVVYPAAGGGVDQFIASEGEDQVEYDKLTLDELKQNAPALLEAFKAEIASEAKPTEDPPTTPTITTEEQIQALVSKQVADILTAEAQKTSTQAGVKAQTTAFLNAAGLPQITRDRLIRQYSVAESYDEPALKLVVEEAKTELRSVGAGPHIVGMGVSESSGGQAPRAAGPSGYHDAVRSSFGIKPKEAK